MNIFALDLDPGNCARYHVNSHVVKMRLETCQLLISAMHKSNGVIHKQDITPEYVNRYFSDFPRKDDNGNPWPYGIGYINHPCCKWTYSSISNFYWLMELGYALCEECKYRFYTKDQQCYRVLQFIEDKCRDITLPCNPDDMEITPFALAITDDLKVESTNNIDRVEAYRSYYCRDKVSLHDWGCRGKPYWLKEME